MILFCILVVLFPQIHGFYCLIDVLYIGPIRDNIPSRFHQYVSDETLEAYLTDTYEHGAQLQGQRCPTSHSEKCNKLYLSGCGSRLNDLGKLAVEQINPWVLTMLIDVENLDMKICYPTQSPGNENVDMSHQEATVKKSDDTSTPADKKSDDTWTKSPTLLLIDEYRKAKHLLENGKIRKNSLWRSISDKLRKQGYTFTDSQVCGRWKTLCRGYKDVKDGRRKSGSGRKDCPYFTELDQILGNDPAVTPSCTISSLKEASPSVSSCDESSSSSAEPKPSEDEDTEPKPVSCVKKARKTQAAEVVQFLQSYVAQQDERHDQQMEEKEKCIEKK